MTPIAEEQNHSYESRDCDASQSEW